MSAINEFSNHQKFDIWLFAVDLVNFVFFRSSKLSSELIAGHFPGFVCKGFSETLKRAVQSIKDTVKPVVDEDFAKFQQRNDVTPESYTKYAKEFRKTHFREGFEGETFLYCSVHLSFLAYRFYRAGVRKAQVSAVFCVAEDFQWSNINYGLWEAFDEIAEKIVHGSSSDGNLPSCSRGIATNSTNCFETPESDRKAKGITSGEKANADSRRGSKLDLSLKKDCFSEDLAKQFIWETLPCSCKRFISPIEEYTVTGHKPPMSLKESLETSLEQLTISSALPLKPVKEEGSSNSTPANSNMKWKHGILKRRTSGNAFEKQMIKLSPINRIKAESVGFK